MVLLLIIFASLFVLRRNGGGTFGLTGLLWRQVRWRFSLDLVRLILLFFYSQGGRLARTWLRNRDSNSRKSGESLVRSLFVYTPFASQVFSLVHLNGSFPSPTNL
jgi:hypothetical protein